ncbi:MAG: transcription antitermination factor NusB [Polyangia bacterium]|jgi:16S rRNA (cytosine967-C5)-methyltransferase|nr:transcription antitermination factor NusB [Polyangia bacterium]
MKPGPIDGRRLALSLLEQVERTGIRAAAALDKALDAAPGLPQPERALATELFYGVLRHQGRLDRALAAYAQGGARGLRKVHPMALRAMRLAAYQILVMDRIPSAAAVNSAVQSVRQARQGHVSGFVNAVLRQLASHGEPPLPDPRSDTLAFLVEAASLPFWLAEQLLLWFGPVTAVSLALSLLERPPTVLCANLLRGSRDLLARDLAALEVPAELCKHSPEGLTMTGSGDPRRLAYQLYAAGRFHVQDEASQLVAHLVGLEPGETLLDACSGRGGKLHHLCALCPDAGLLLALDRNQGALRHLNERARRLSARHASPLRADLCAPLPLAPSMVFDAVLLDAPCSGLGVLRRHPESKLRLRLEDLADLSARQAALLDRLAPMVRFGGRLVYAVCTFSPAEGPEQVEAFLSRHPEFDLEPPPAGPVDWSKVLGSDGLTVSLSPHRHGTDGFFMARLRRLPRG